MLSGTCPYSPCITCMAMKIHQHVTRKGQTTPSPPPPPPPPPPPLVVNQPRRFVAQSDKGIEGFGMLARNLLGTWNSLGIRPGVRTIVFEHFSLSGYTFPASMPRTPSDITPKMGRTMRGTLHCPSSPTQSTSWAAMFFPTTSLLVEDVQPSGGGLLGRCAQGTIAEEKANIEEVRTRIGQL